jgi:hypothetical protein
MTASMMNSSAETLRTERRISRFGHGRADLPQGPLYHRRRGEHLPVARRQSRYRQERHRPGAGAGDQTTESGDPLGSRDSELQDPLDDRRRSLVQVAERGQITGGLLDGPLAFDNAISREAAEIKHIKSAVCGDADILLVPDLEAGNMLYKEFFANADAAGIVLGARVPVILTSRADSVSTRMASCAAAALYAHSRRTAPAGSGKLAG